MLQSIGRKGNYCQQGLLSSVKDVNSRAGLRASWKWSRESASQPKKERPMWVIGQKSRSFPVT